MFLRIVVNYVLVSAALAAWFCIVEPKLRAQECPPGYECLTFEESIKNHEVSMYKCLCGEEELVRVGTTDAEGILTIPDVEKGVWYKVVPTEVVRTYTPKFQFIRIPKEPK